MAYTVPDPNGDTTPRPPTVLLRRLANPNLAPQPNPAAAGYNPYVTVDYIDMSKVTPPPAGMINDGRQYTSTGTNPNYVAAVTSRYSFGRQQPYAGVAAQWKQQAQPGQPEAAGHLLQRQHAGRGPGQRLAGSTSTARSSARSNCFRFRDSSRTN